jgi:hypothetical protein
MAKNKLKSQPPAEDIHAFLEKTLIESYLKGKGYTLHDLKKLPEKTARQLMKEASTFASCKLADVEVKARLVKKLHDAYIGE